MAETCFMPGVAKDGGCFSLYSTESRSNGAALSFSSTRNRTQLRYPLESLSFKQSVSKHLRTCSSRSLSHKRQGLMPFNAVVGYPTSITWWKKGDQPNMREINSTQELVEALTKAGDKLVLVEFFSVGCRSCKALYPKICQLAAENPDIEVLKVNFHDNVAMCRSLNVSILPFFHFYREAECIDAFSTSLSRINKLREAVAKHKRGRVQITSPAPVTLTNEVLVGATSTLATAGSAV